MVCSVAGAFPSVGFVCTGDTLATTKPEYVAEVSQTALPNVNAFPPFDVLILNLVWSTMSVT